MTMNKYNSIEELRSAKRRLYFRKEELETEMKDHVASLKHSLTPSGILANITHSHNGAAKPGPGQSVLTNVSSTLLDIVINDVFMRRSSYLKRFMTSYFIRLFGPTLIKNAGPVVSNLIKKSGLMKHFNGQSGKEHDVTY